MATLNAIIAIITITGMGCVAWGYRQALSTRGTATWHFSLGTALLAASLGLRWLYWDVVRTVMRHHSPDLAAAVSAAHGGTAINLLFNGLVLVAIYHSLKARWLLLPDEDRGNWHWWNAWAHPQGIFPFRRR